MIRNLSVVAALAILIGSGVANGIWNDRWRVSNELGEMTAKLPQVPMTIGDWVAKDDDPEKAATKEERERLIEEREKQQKFTERLKRNGTLHELITRIYTDQRNGQRVELLMATGRPGPISTHNPLTCVGGANSSRELVGRPAQAKLDLPGNRQAVFSHADFVPTNPTDSGLRVYWSWRDPDKGWVSVRDARAAFASQRALTKIYVTRSLTGVSQIGERQDDELIMRFLKECLPTINATLFNES